MFSSKIRRLLFILFFILSFSPNQVISQINPNLDFYPLHIGDTWQYLVEYKYFDSSKDSSYYASVYVREIDTLNDGNLYYRITNSENYCLKYIRVDSTDATVWNEIEMLDSLSMQPLDEMSMTYSENPKMCLRDSTETLLDTEIRVKTFVPVSIPVSQSYSVNSEVKYLYKYAWGIGELYSETSDIGMEASRIVRTLNYAKIDNVEYGNYVPENVNTNFFPLQVGNKWVYNNAGVQYDTEPHPFNYDFVMEIVSDTTVVEGRKYYKVTDRFGQFFWLRKDTVSNSIYKKDDLMSDNAECLFADFPSNFTENYYVCNGITNNIINSDTLLWGNKRSRKEFFYESVYTYEEHFVSGIGIVKKKNEFDTGYSITSLKGCIIDGVIFGDTTYTGVEENISELPTKISLSQNYPNPFNPSTTIKYSIPVETRRGVSPQKVKLIVYDILGRRIATLVNKEQKAGNYEVNFDASELTSGIYFYTLQVGKYRATNKMLLIK